jgi:hypothetical protein
VEWELCSPRQRLTSSFHGSFQVTHAMTHQLSLLLLALCATMLLCPSFAQLKCKESCTDMSGGRSGRYCNTRVGQCSYQTSWLDGPCSYDEDCDGKAWKRGPPPYAGKRPICYMPRLPLHAALGFCGLGSLLYPSQIMNAASSPVRMTPPIEHTIPCIRLGRFRRLPTAHVFLHRAYDLL